MAGRRKLAPGAVRRGPAHPPSHQLTHAVLALLLVLPCIVGGRIGERRGRCQQLTLAHECEVLWVSPPGPAPPPLTFMVPLSEQQGHTAPESRVGERCGLLTRHSRGA